MLPASRRCFRELGRAAVLGIMLSLLTRAVAQAQESGEYLFNDVHFHLTNYIQEGLDLAEYLQMMGSTVKRSTLFGIPLQQMWDYGNTGDFAPEYYLQTDAPLYYYSFTDAAIATAYRSLPPDQRARLDPMITGFNPADMYAVDHIRRVLLTYPGVFSGIGEFTIHKEFVSAKIAGGPAALGDSALHRILDFAGEAGLVVLLHNDVNVPFPRPDQDPYMVRQLRDLIMAHPDATVIWAHIGLGRVVRPIEGQLAMIERALNSDELSHLYFDLSWDETAKYITASPQAVEATAALINRFPDRFLFGSDVVAPTSIDVQTEVYEIYEPLWDALTPRTKQMVLLENYERLFDAARVKVRAWEQANAGRREWPRH